MIEKFIDSALIIDERADEVQELIALLTEKDIWVKHYTPADFKEQKLKNRKIIFLDLYLDDTRSDVENISTIRQLFKKHIGLNFGTYGVVLWTKHDDKLDEFIKRIQKDSTLYTLPLFIVGLDKNIYKRNGNYNSLFDDLNKKLSENVAASFFLEWFSLVNQGKDKAIKSIYSLVEEFEYQNENLRFVLFQLAKNLNDIPIDQIEQYPLHIDAYKALNDIMIYESLNQNNIVSSVFNDFKKIKYRGTSTDSLGYSRKAATIEYFQGTTSINKKDATHKKAVQKLDEEIYSIYSQLNSSSLIDDTNLNQAIVIPGNIYEVLIDENIYKPALKKSKGKSILIEMTPPCDFSQGNMNVDSKVLSGLILDYSSDIMNLNDELNKEYYYKQIYPITLPHSEKPQIIIFDFRYLNLIKKKELQDKAKFKLILRVKNKLFADILQKLSSHMSRLGVSIIH